MWLLARIRMRFIKQRMLIKRINVAVFMLVLVFTYHCEEVVRVMQSVFPYAVAETLANKGPVKFGRHLISESKSNIGTIARYSQERGWLSYDAGAPPLVQLDLSNCRNGFCADQADGDQFIKTSSSSGAFALEAATLKRINIDATELSTKGLLIYGGTDIIDTTQVRQVSLAEGDYPLQVYSSVFSPVTFKVTAAGTVDYDPSFDGVLSGRGTDTLKIHGKRIVIDATQLSQSGMLMLAFHHVDGKLASLEINNRVPQELTLLPTIRAGYQFIIGSAKLADFSFGVDLAGNIVLAPETAYLASGAGTPTLKIKGYHVSINLPAGIGDTAINAGEWPWNYIGLKAGQQNDIYLLPYNGGSGYGFKIGDVPVYFNVDKAGNLTGNPVFMSLFGVHSDGAPYCSAEETRAAENGWSLTPLSCQGFKQQEATEFIDSPMPTVAPQAYPTSNGRPPNQLPHLSKPAGGDPVLSDGEFFLQRVDAELAGYGLHYEFRRTYRSGIDTSGPLGSRWNHNYNQRLIGKVLYTPSPSNYDPKTLGDLIGPNCDRTISYQDGEGNLQRFTGASWGLDVSHGTRHPVYHFVPDSGDLRLDYYWAGSFWKLIRSDGTVSIFDQAGFLVSTTDRAGNSLRFEWDRATAPSFPACDPTDKKCQRKRAEWRNKLIKEQIGQQRRLARVIDATRTVNYIYAETDPTRINSANQMRCISLGLDCTAHSTVLASFSFDGTARLTGVAHGAAGSARPIETYSYYRNPSSDVSVSEMCSPSADINAYCRRLCDPWKNNPNDCNNLGWAERAIGYCVGFGCVDKIPKAECPYDDIAGQVPLGNGKTVICCNSSFGGPPPDQLCLDYLHARPTCYDGCTYKQQCTEVRNGKKYAIYAYGLNKELANNIIEVRDEKNQLVVRNEYGTDRAASSFGKVTRQQLGSGTGDNVIAFEYHDLTDYHPTYSPTSGPPAWPGSYKTPDPTGVIARYLLPRDTVLTICPKKCAISNSDGACRAYDYEPAKEERGREPFDFITSAVLIHDLHGITRLQYLGQGYDLRREVTVETNEVTDYQYLAPSLFVSGIRMPSGVRQCFERDDVGRVLQSSVVPIPGDRGRGAVAQATLFRYDGYGQATDITRDALGKPTPTHFERDNRGRIIRMEQKIAEDAPAQLTLFQYDGETPPAGVLETPTQVIYPNGRIDTFSQFDVSLGGPRSIVVDAGSKAPERRYVKYDVLGRVVESGEIDRFAQQYVYDDPADLWRLTRTQRRLDKNQAWIETTLQSHVVNGETVLDAMVEPRRTTTFTNVGSFPMQKDLVATVASPGTALSATQTSCYNYSADGHLEASLLPEGNGLSFSYTYDTTGTTVVAKKGFGVPTNPSWAAGCAGRTPPANDPGLGLQSVRHVQPGGFITSETDEQFRTRQYETDGLGRIIQISAVPDDQRPESITVQQLGYDSKGHRIWEALLKPGMGLPNQEYRRPKLGDARLLGYAEYDYDLIGRLREQRTYVLETGEVLTTTIRYDTAKRTVTVTDRGAVTTTQYDGRGRLVSQTAPDGSTATRTYDLGVVTVTQPTNSRGKIIRRFEYDTRGLLTAIRDENDVALYTATYDDNGQQTTETRAGLGQVTWTYDAFDRLIQEDKTLASGIIATSRYGYDRNDRVTTYVDAESHAWKMTFTGTDAPLTVLNPLGRLGTYTYLPSWPRSLVARMQEPNGRVTSFAYDSEGRPIDVYMGECPATRAMWECDGVRPSQRHTVYDERGQVRKISVPADQNRLSVVFAYDSLGRMTQERVGLSTVQHTFADAGRTMVTQVTHDTAVASMTHRYDTMGRLQGIELGGQTLASFDYGIGAGGRLSATYANGAEARYSYDEKLRQTGIDVTFGEPGTLVASLHEAFGVDSIPRLRQRKIGTAPSWTDAFLVDGDGRVMCEKLRLTDVTLPTGEIGNGDVGVCMEAGTQWRQYAIDKIGNIRQQKTASSTLVHDVDGLSRLLKFGNDPVNHDATDNLTGRAGSDIEFTFDPFIGNLTSTRNASKVSKFEYDALDRRRLEHRPDGPDQVFVWDGNQLIGHGDAVNLRLDVPGEDMDEHIASVDQFGAGTKWFYHQGPDQSVLAVTGSTGLVEGYTYSAFGELSIWNGSGQTISQSTFDNSFQFQGQLYDALTATYSMRARQYQPEWGRFLSPDPLSIAGGPSLYAFTGSRPLQNRDPLGFISCSFNTCYLDDAERAWALATVGYRSETRSEFIGRSYASAIQLDETHYLLNGEVHEQQYTLTADRPIRDETGRYASAFYTDQVIRQLNEIEGAGLISRFGADRVFAERSSFWGRVADYIVDHPYKSGVMIGVGVFSVGVGGGAIYGLASGSLTVTAVGATVPVLPRIADIIEEEGPALEATAARVSQIAQPVSVAVRAITSRINISIEAWVHVINRHMLEGGGSQFSIPGSRVYALLGSPQVIGSPIVRVIQSKEGLLFVREVQLVNTNIGIDKFTNQMTSILTVMTDRLGNLVTAFPGVLRQ